MWKPWCLLPICAALAAASSNWEEEWHELEPPKMKPPAQLVRGQVTKPVSNRIDQFPTAEAPFGGCGASSNANWMKDFQGKAMKDLTLLGSHDAGCIKPYIKEIWIPNTWAVTQRKTLADQMCAGYRVFDLRFRVKEIVKHKKADGTIEERKDWEIHHGKPMAHSYFQTLEQVGGHISSFCNMYDTELIVLRIKVEDSKKIEDHVSVYSRLADAINQGPKKCIVQKPGPFFSGDSIATLKSSIPSSDPTATGSPVVIMPHVKDKLKAVLNEPAVANLVFDYDANQQGKAAKSYQMKKVLSSTKPGQDYQHQNWLKAKQTNPNLSFGFWMTMTGGVDTGGIRLNVRDNSKKLFDCVGWKDGSPECKYNGWIYHLISHYAGDAGNGLEGWTIWTDWAGDEEMSKTRDAVIMMNQYLAIPGSHTLTGLTSAILPQSVRIRRGKMARTLPFSNTIEENKAPAKVLIDSDDQNEEEEEEDADGEEEGEEEENEDDGDEEDEEQGEDAENEEGEDNAMAQDLIQIQHDIVNLR